MIKKIFYVLLVASGGIYFAWEASIYSVKYYRLPPSEPLFKEYKTIYINKTEGRRDYLNLKLTKENKVFKYYTIPEQYKVLSVGDTVAVFESKKAPVFLCAKFDWKFQRMKFLSKAIMNGILGLGLLFFAFIGILVPSKNFKNEDVKE